MRFLQSILTCTFVLTVAAKQFYFVSFDGSNDHQQERDTGNNWKEDYYPIGLCVPRKSWSSYCTEGYLTNDECKNLCDFDQYPDGAAYYLIDNGAVSPFLNKDLGASSNLALGRQDGVSQGHTMDGKIEVYGPQKCKYSFCKRRSMHFFHYRILTWIAHLLLDTVEFHNTIAIDGDIETCSIADPDINNPWWKIDLGTARQIGKIKVVSSKFFLIDNFEVYGADAPLGPNDVDDDLDFSNAYMCSNQTSVDYQDDGKISQNFASNLDTLRPTFLLPCIMRKRYVYIRINTRAADQLAVFSLCEGRFFCKSNRTIPP